MVVSECVDDIVDGSGESAEAAASRPRQPRQSAGKVLTEVLPLLAVIRTTALHVPIGVVVFPGRGNAPRLVVFVIEELLPTGVFPVGRPTGVFPVGRTSRGRALVIDPTGVCPVGRSSRSTRGSHAREPVSNTCAAIVSTSPMSIKPNTNIIGR
jgi:hypothetical protein